MKRLFICLLLALPTWAATTVATTFCSSTQAIVRVRQISVTGATLSDTSASYSGGVFSQALLPGTDGSSYQLSINCPALIPPTNTNERWLIPDSASTLTRAKVAVAAFVSVQNGYYWDTASLTWLSGAAGIASTGGGTPTGTAGGSLSGTYPNPGLARVDVVDAIAFCADAGSTDAYACALSPAITAYVTGTHYRFKAATANTGAATIAFNSLASPKTIVKVAGGITTALADNDIRAGQWVDIVYDGTNMQMQSTLGNTASGSAAFSAITSATNSSAAMVVGTGASLAPSGTGYITPKDHGGQVYNVQAYGVVTGDVDTAGANSTAMLALLATVNTAGGGTIYFPPGTYRFDSQFLLPNDGASPQQNQNNIRITGAGGGGAWYTTDVSILDLRYVSGDQNAKIETRGRGTLMIDHLTISDGGASNVTPMIHTTNTTLLLYDNTFIMSGNVAQDAIVLGGTTETVSTGVNSPFQGYITKITNNHFRNGNRALYGLTYANGVIFEGNSFQANTGTIAVEFDGTGNGGGGVDYGNSILNNNVEMDTYVNFLKAKLFAKNLISGNNMHDAGSNVTGYYNLVYPSTQNTIICGASPITKPFLIGDNGGYINSVICSEFDKLDSSGKGIAGSELSGGLVVKGKYVSGNAYPGALTIAWQDGVAKRMSLGYDDSGDTGIIDCANNATPVLCKFISSGIKAPAFFSTTNCSSAASPAVCAAAPAGAVAIPTGVTSVSLVVNTTAVTASSQILLTSDDTLTIAATTCNSTLATLVGGLAVTARTPGTSFTITYNGTIATNPLCVSYSILN